LRLSTSLVLSTFFTRLSRSLSSLVCLSLSFLKLFLTDRALLVLS